MNILLPIAGLGSRFPNSKIPKPLIEVHGKPMISAAVESIGLDGNYIFIIREEHDQKYNLEKKLKDLIDCTVIKVDYLTKGPACTALLAEEFINNNEPLIIANCDQIMHWDKKTFNTFCKYYPHDGFVVTYFADTPMNSYVKINSNGFATLMKEKEVISNISTNGIHFWKKGSFFTESANSMIFANDTAPNGEFYIAPTYNYMIEMGLKVGIYHIPNEQHWAVGTENDLAMYLRTNNNEQR
jgi:dTDP-glucose pyrophosphorylase